MIFSSKGRNNKLFKKNQKGVTLIEALFVLAIATVVITGWLTLVNEESKRTTIKNYSTDFANVLKAVSRRTQFDGFSWSLWNNNGTRTPDGNTFISWEGNSEVSEGLFDLFLVASGNTTCGDPAGWVPRDRTVSGTDVVSTRALYNCGVLRDIIPYNIDMSAVISSDGLDDDIEQVDQFKFYLDISNTDLYNEEDRMSYITALKRYTETNFNINFDQLPASHTIDYGDRNLLDDPNDDITYTASTCSTNLFNGDPCYLILSIDFSGATNDVHLRTDGANSMLGSINFADGIGSNNQTCIWWQKPNDTGHENSVLSGGNTVGVWTAREIDCGIYGGSDSPVYVEAVLDNQYAESFLITNKDETTGAALTHMCQVYTNKSDTERQFQDANSDNDVPCGIMENGDVIQLAVEQAFVGQAFISDLVSSEIYSNGIEITYDPTLTQNLDSANNSASLTDLVNEINRDNVAILLNVMDDNRNSVFTIDNLGNTNIMGELTVEENALFMSNLEIRDSLTVANVANFQMDNGSDIVFGRNNDLVFNNATVEFEMYTRSGLNLDLISGNILNLQGESGVNILNQTSGDISIVNNNPTGDINIQGNGGEIVMASSGGAYYAKNTINGVDQTTTSFNALSATEKEGYELVTKDYANYLEDRMGDVIVRQTLAVQSGLGNVISKPNCLDFVSSNDKYVGTTARARADANEGFDLARILIVPLYFKTYAAALGNNQIFTQHAIHSSDTEWEVYMYLSGEGIQGTGGREDAAGSGIALILCDYSDVDFTI